MFGEIFDVSLLATIALIFLISLIGAYLRSSRRDPCLHSFDGYHVTIERNEGKHIWGILELETTGLELSYRNSVQDTRHVESSYILYNSEYSSIRALYRYSDQLTEPNRQRRSEDVARSFYPGPLRRLGRAIRRFVANASDSLGEVLGLLVGRLRKPVGRYLTDQSEAHIKSLGTTFIGHVGYAHDPLLEKFIGQRVVVELLEADNAVHEHVGIFKNYSADFIEILDVQFPQGRTLNFRLAAQDALLKDVVRATAESNVVVVENLTNQPLLIESLGRDEHEELLNVVVDAGEKVELFPEHPLAETELHLRYVRELDMIIPRTHCVVRHRVEQYQPDIIADIVFDLGVVLTRGSIIDERERRLRRILAKNPRSALGAVNLGAILLQKRQDGEAEKWLRQALGMTHALPDRGKRARMLLRELERRTGQEIHAPPPGTRNFGPDMRHLVNLPSIPGDQV